MSLYSERVILISNLLVLVLTSTSFSNQRCSLSPWGGWGFWFFARELRSLERCAGRALRGFPFGLFGRRDLRSFERCAARALRGGVFGFWGGWGLICDLSMTPPSSSSMRVPPIAKRSQFIAESTFPSCTLVTTR